MAESARLFLKLTGPAGQIKGESVVADKRDWIEIDDWSWDLETSGNKDDTQAVRPTVLSFGKTMDRATTSMLGAMQNGTLLSASIELDDASGDMFDLNLHFKDVRLLSYDLRTEVADKRVGVSEKWSMDYSSVRFEYKPDSRSGAMNVELVRPPGSSTNVPDDKEGKFRELSADMSVQDLQDVWKKMDEVRSKSESVKKAMEARAAAKAKPGANAGK